MRYQDIMGKCIMRTEHSSIVKKLIPIWENWQNVPKAPVIWNLYGGLKPLKKGWILIEGQCDFRKLNLVVPHTVCDPKFYI